MFYKIFVCMLLVGMSCVGASQKGGGGTGQTTMSDEELRQKYNEISGEIAALTNDNLGKQKLTQVLEQIKFLGTRDFTRRSVIGVHKGRSNIYSIHLIQELLEIGFYKPRLSSEAYAEASFSASMKSQFVDECLAAAEFIFNQIMDQNKQKTEREQFMTYFNGQNFQTNTDSFTVSITKNELVSKEESKKKKTGKPSRVVSDRSMGNLGRTSREENEAWRLNTAL